MREIGNQNLVNDTAVAAATGLAEAADACNLLAVNQKRVGGRRMRIAIIGQQDFGKAALEAFLARGDEVAAVFCAPETGRPDPLRLTAEARGVTVHQLPTLTDPAAQEAMRAANVELGVMAYVTQFAPQEFCSIPKFGTIQFHPSLLPLHRGASSMSWATGSPALTSWPSTTSSLSTTPSVKHVTITGVGRGSIQPAA